MSDSLSSFSRFCTQVVQRARSEASEAIASDLVDNLLPAGSPLVFSQDDVRGFLAKAAEVAATTIATEMGAFSRQVEALMSQLFTQSQEGLPLSLDLSSVADAASLASIAKAESSPAAPSKLGRGKLQPLGATSGAGLAALAGLKARVAELEVSLAAEQAALAAERAGKEAAIASGVKASPQFATMRRMLQAKSEEAAALRREIASMREQ
jgi:hypothetical protein